jgi:integrase
VKRQCLNDIAGLRRRMVAEGHLTNGTINRHLATVRAMFNQALKWELYEGRNPAASPGMLREVHRDKYLSPEETQAMMRALDADQDQTAAAALALLTVTGARRNEIRLATWENVDFGRGMLTVPRAKNGRPRYIPLSPFAVAVLERQLAKRNAGGRAPGQAGKGAGERGAGR